MVQSAEEFANQWWEAIYTSGWTKGLTLIIARDAAILTEERAAHEGHRELCYYCQQPCDSLAGNPSSWPVALCHADEPGVAKWHHAGCVSERLCAGDEAREPAPDIELRRKLDRLGR